VMAKRQIVIDCRIMDRDFRQGNERIANASIHVFICVLLKKNLYSSFRLTLIKIIFQQRCHRARNAFATCKIVVGQMASCVDVGMGSSKEIT
jgi:hypothetical protein